MTSSLRIGILAGESSGDILGSGLMTSIKEKYPEAVFEGIGGPLMIAQGLKSQAPMERLSVMGLIEPLKRLPELLRIRKKLINSFLKNKPDVFIGIDSPDFTLTIEKQLKHAGIPTVHYVSPSVWAWRSKRIKKIKQSVDLMLTLFPFEAKFYQENLVDVCFVGHPLADQIPLDTEMLPARVALELKSNAPVLALLPGSRGGEVARLAPEFLKTARLCLKRWPDLQVILPCSSRQRREQVQDLLNSEFNDLSVTLFDGKSHECMAAADLILIASGTATLEALLLKKPMVVCYKMARFSYALISRLLKVPYFSLPNLLAGKKLVEERVQDQVQAEALFESLQKLMQDQDQQALLNKQYSAIHQQLRRNANQSAADAVLSLVAKSK